MKERKELEKKIEELREELNQSILADSYEKYYAKSVELDKLLEAYLDSEK